MSLEVRSLSKRYGQTQALSDVSMLFEAGEIHAVLGENGAGKSTLVGILSGFVQPDSGQAILGDNVVPFGSPSAIQRLGVQLIHQHFTLVPQFTGEENLALGSLDGLAGALRIGELTDSAKEIAERLGWSLRLGDSVRTYSVGEQQRLEILRVLSLGGDVLLFDEPTAVLADHEVEDLLNVLRSLREAGKIVVLIAHKLSEVLAVADRVTVLRKGVVVASEPRANVDAEKLVTWMVGELTPLATPAAKAHFQGEGLIVNDLWIDSTQRTSTLNLLPPSSSAQTNRPTPDTEKSGRFAIHSVSIKVARGEILGIGGVDGNGQIELAEALAGVRPTARGSISFDGQTTGYHTAYIPQDRQRDGLAMGMSIRENLLIEGVEHRDLLLGPFIRPKKANEWAKSLVDRFEIKIGSLDDPVADLSGGNGQKVVVSRTLDRLPDLLVAVNPSRGLDVRATAYVHEKVRAAAEQGCAILLISTDADELAALASRRLFLSRGRISATDRPEDLVGGTVW